MAVLGGTVRWVIEADDSEFNSAVDSAKSKAEELGSALKKADTSKGLFGGFSSQATETGLALSGLAKSVASVGWGAFSAGATAATGALTTLVTKGIQGTDFLESARTQMSGLTGSMEAGNAALAKAAQFWQNNPFDRFTTTNATKQLIQFGRTVNQIDDDLDLLGKISQSTGTPLDELARYFARTAASGRAMTLDIEMMSDRGIPIYQKLSEVTGKTTQGIREMASQGQISFEIFQQALERAVNPEAMEQFEQTLARQKDRLSGSISTLSGDLAGYKIVNDQLVISANGLEKAYTRLLKTLATELRGEKLRSSMEKLGQSFAKIVDKIEPLIPLIVDKLSKGLDFVANHSSALIPILGGVLAVFGKFGSTIPGIGGIITGVSNAFGGLGNSIKTLVSKSPLLSTFIALFGVGFVSAYKNSESFRKSISDLFSALGNLFKAIVPVVQSFIKVFVKIASSKAVVAILQTVVNVLTLLANVLSKIPTDVLTGLVTALLTFKLLSVSPISALALGIVVLTSAISDLIDEAGGLGEIGKLFTNLWSNISNGIGNFAKNISAVGKTILSSLSKPITSAVQLLKQVPNTLLTVGNNIMVGLFNGLVSGAKRVTEFVKSVALNIVSTFKSVLGIHSPSTVMEQQGKFIVLGLANGITNNSSVVEKAMDKLATAVLSAAEKVVNNKVEFGLFNYNDEYKAWKKVSKLFTVGSEQYKSAMEKMEEARKNVNLRIITLQKEYNDTLDSTISKISTMYGLFDKVDLSGGMNIEDITGNLDEQVARLNEYATAQEAIANLDLDPRFIEELQQMGVDATNELSAIASASTSQLAQLNSLWLKKQEAASRAATVQLAGLKKDTLNEIAELKNGIDEETVDVIEVGGRLVSNIGDGITGALPTLDSAFAQLNEYIAAEVKSASGSLSEAGSVIDPEDYAKGLSSGFDETLQKIQGSVEEFGKGLFGMIGGALIGTVAWKVLGKNLTKGLGSKLSSIFSGLSGIGKSAKGIKDTADVAKQVAEVGEGLTQSSQTLVKSGSELTKAQSAMKTIRSGIVNIILLAGAIAAMGIALKIAYEAIPSDIGGLSAKMGVMAGVVASMGVLAALGGKFDESIKEGLKLIAAIAGDVALTAIAIGVANALIPDDMGNLIPKLGVLGGVITAMGILAGVGGLFDETIMDGLKLIAIIAGEIALTGVAIGIANAMIPDDLGTMVGELGVMGLAIAEFAALAAIIDLIPANFVAGLITIIGIAGSIALVGLALGVADQAIQSNFDVFMGKLGIMGLAITEFGVLAGVIGALMSTGIGAVFLGAGLVAILGICAGIAATAVAIGEIDRQIPNDIDSVKNKIGLIAEVMNVMVKADFGNIIGNLKNAINIEAIAVIATGFKYIGTTLKEIGEIQIDTNTIKDKVAKIKECVELLAELQTGSVFKQYKNAINTSFITLTVNNIRNIVEGISKCILLLDGLSKAVGENNKVSDYVNDVKNIVEQLASLQTGSFWKQLNNATATQAISETTKTITQIISEVTEICGKLRNLNEEYGNGKATELVKDAISIVEAFGGIDLGGGQIGWFSWSKADRIAKDVEQIHKVSNLIQDIISSAKNTFGIVRELGISSEDQAKAEVAKAVNIINALAGADVKRGGGGWFSSSIYVKLAADLVDIQKVAEQIKSIIDAAKSISENIRDFTSGGGQSMATYVEEANKIIEALAGIEIPQGWVEDTANKSGSLNTTAGNIGNILTAATTIVDKLTEFAKQKVNVPALVKQANIIIQAFAEIKISQEHVESTSKNAGYLKSTAENINTILGQAKDIIAKMQDFDKIGVEKVKNLVGDANAIIGKFAELNLNGDKNYQQLSENTSSLSSAVSSVREIIEKASTTIDVVRAFVKKYPLDQLQEDITGANGINETLKRIAGIKVEGLENGEETITRLTQVKDIVGKVQEIAEAINNVPDTAEKAANISTIVSFIDKELSSLPEILKTYADSFIEVGKAYANAFADGWTSTYDAAIDNGKALAYNYINGIKTTLNDFKKAGSDAQGEFWGAIQAKFPDEYSQGASLAQQVLDGINSLKDKFEEAGKFAIEGFTKGVDSGNPYAKGTSIASKFLQGLKDAGEQGSPWKTTYRSGIWAAEGLINGLEDSEAALVDEATSLADALVKAMDMSDVEISPTLDANVNPFSVGNPSFDFSNPAVEYGLPNRREVVIEQTNNNYTQYSLEKVNSDLRWALSKV